MLTAGIGVGSLDGIIKFSGADYITFDGIDLKESTSNTTTATQMEWGYALLKVDGTNGSQHITIKNCSITLNKTNTATYGIYSANHTIASTTALTVTAFSGTNSSNQFYSNQIQNCYSGIYVAGYSSGSPYNLFDHFNQIGVGGGNIIRTFGGAASTTYGVYTIYQDSLAVSNNDIAGGTGTTTTEYGIMISTATNASVLVYNNTVSDTTSSTTSSTYGIALNNAGVTGTDNTVIVKRNTVQGMTSTATTSGALYGYYIYYTTSINLYVDSNKFINNKWGGTAQTATGTIYGFYIYPYTTAPVTGSVEYITNNYISGNKRTQSTVSTGTLYGMYIYYGNQTVNTYNNIIENDTLLTTTSTSYYMYVYNYYSTTVSYYNNIIRNIYKPSGASTIYGYYISNAAYTGTFNYYNNTVNNIRSPFAAASIYGHYNAASSVSKEMYGNTAYSLYSSGSGSVYGMNNSAGTTVNLYRNSIYDLRTATGSGYGITISGGTSVNAYNNFVSDIRCDSVNSTLALMGIYISGGTTIGAYYNTVYLNSVSTGASFGTAGIYASTAPTVELKNNLVVNVSTPGASGGFATAYQRSSNSIATFSPGSNNNVYYVAPGTGRLIYYDGTTQIPGIEAYKQLVTPRESNSFSENPPFVNISTPPYDLHISTSVQTGIEGMATPISSPIAITTDFDGNTRNATTPDIGADEGNFIFGDYVSPVISYTPLTNTMSLSNRTLDATITDNYALQNTPPNDPRIYYKKGVNGTWRYYNKTSQSGNNFTFTIYHDSLGIGIWDTVFYYVAANDVGTPPLNPNVTTNPSGGSGYNPPGTVPPPAPNYYIIVTNPLSGVFTIPGNYPTIAAAIGDLNLRGINGPVTFNVAQNHVEVASNLTLLTTGTASNPIVFQKAGSDDKLLVNNPAVVAGQGTGAMDGIIKFAGVDYVTFDGIDLRDTTANTNDTTRMEWGYALLKADVTNGSQNITIKNCSITLNNINTATCGIYSANHTVSSTATLNVTAFSGTNSNNKFYGNQIQNCYSGIYLSGFAALTPFDLYDHFNQVGVQGANIIRNFGGSAVTPYGIYTIYQDSLSVCNNDIAGGTGTTITQYGIMISTATNASVLVYNNTISDTTASLTSSTFGIALNNAGYTGTDNTVIVKRNTVQGMTSTAVTSGALYGYYIYYTTSINLYIDSNRFINNKWGGPTQTATGTIYGFYIYPYTTAPVAGSVEYITNNYLSGNKRTQSAVGAGTLYGMYIYYGNQTVNAYNNIIENDTLSTTTGTSYYMYVYNYYATTVSYYNNIIRNIYKPSGASTIYGYYISNAAYTGTFNYYNNTVNNIRSPFAAAPIYGHYNAATSVSKEMYGNTAYSLYSSGSGSVYGITNSAGTTVNLYRNSVYDLRTATGAGNGISISGGTTVNAYNNFISEIRCDSGTSTTALSGINISGGTTVGAYYNTIYLNAVSTSSTTFGTAGIYASTTPTVDMRNNIVVNVSTPGPTGGFTTAYQRSSTTLTTYANTSNNNIFYGGTPSANRVLFYDGTNSDITLDAYKTRVAPRDNVSLTENPPFINVTTTPYDLHISPSVPTGVESRGVPITTPVAITTDYDNQTRNATTPDIGADEGTFTVLVIPAAPILISPANGATNQPVTLTCVWGRPFGANLLKDVKSREKSPTELKKSSPVNEKSVDELDAIERFWFEGVSDTVSMANLLRDTTRIDTTISWSGLSYQTTYFWRVKAKNAAGWSNFSSWWRFTTMPPPVAMLNLTVIPGGFYNSGTGTLNMRDTIRAILIDSTGCSRVDSARGVLDSVTFSANISFTNANTGNYYLYIFHRNHVFISARYEQSIIRGSTVNYDFTTDSSKAYGFNMVKVSTSPVRWGMIPGDANQDGFVDGLDQTIWIAQNGLDGYWPSDFNGDLFVDGLDQTIWIFMNGQSYFVPCELSFENVVDHAKKTGSIYNRQTESITMPKFNNNK